MVLCHKNLKMQPYPIELVWSVMLKYRRTRMYDDPKEKFL